MEDKGSSDDDLFELEIAEKRRRPNLGRHEPDIVIEKRIEIYRRTTLGQTLTGALEELKTSNKIQPHLADIILQQFDRSIARNLHYVSQNIVFVSDRVAYYRLINGTWKFKLKDVIVSEADAELAQVKSCTLFAAVPKDITIGECQV